MEADVATQNMTSMASLESASFWWGLFAVSFAATTAVCGFFAWWSSSRLADAKDRALKDFQSRSAVEISSANARTAEAQKATEELRKQQAPRFTHIDPNASNLGDGKLKSLLTGKVTGEVNIAFEVDDAESFILATCIHADLKNSGWNVVQFGELPNELSIRPFVGVPANRAPLEIRAGGYQLGINVVSPVTDDSTNPDMPAGVLKQAIAGCELMVGGGVNPKLPPNRIMVVVGKKH